MQLIVSALDLTWVLVWVILKWHKRPTKFLPLIAFVFHAILIFTATRQYLPLELLQFSQSDHLVLYSLALLDRSTLWATVLSVQNGIVPFFLIAPIYMAISFEVYTHYSEVETFYLVEIMCMCAFRITCLVAGGKIQQYLVSMAVKAESDLNRNETAQREFYDSMSDGILIYEDNKDILF